jgi:hypothetical protein
MRYFVCTTLTENSVLMHKNFEVDHLSEVHLLRKQGYYVWRAYMIDANQDIIDIVVEQPE